MPSLMIYHTSGLEEEREVVSQLTMGRLEVNDVMLAEGGVSRRHARFFIDNDELWVEDLGSANGTFVDGERIKSPVCLNDKAQVCIGDCEIVVHLTPIPRGGKTKQKAAASQDWDDKTVAPQRKAAAIVKKQAAQAPLSRKPQRSALAQKPPQRVATSRYKEQEAEAADADGAPRRKKMLFIVAGVVVVFALVAVALKLMAPPSSPGVAKLPPTLPLPPPQDNEAAELEKALKKCRQHLQWEARSMPDYRQAAEACRRALDFDPLNKEANNLMKKIALESECARHFEQGKQAVDLEPEKAVASFLQINSECTEHQRHMVELYDRARRNAEDGAKRGCQDYTRAKSWRLAYEQCELYMNLVCPEMSEEELYPPGGKTLVVESNRQLKRNEWRPANELYRNFLLARSQADPRASTWRCPLEVKKPPPPGSTKGEAEKWFADRFNQTDFEQAILAYFIGKTQDALNKLALVRKDMKKINLHEDANRLQVQIRQVDTAFNDGMAALERANVKEAAEHFQNVLEKDKVLILGADSGMTEYEEKVALSNHLKSFFRNNVMVDMPNKCLSIGEDWRKRNNPNRACQIWKVGYHFNQNNTDLLSSLARYCTVYANELLKKASNCSSLREVLEYAVEGDGLRQKVEKLQSDNNCPR